MRHRRHTRRLNRTMEHRKALRRNMAQSLFEHGFLTTTVPKAKNLQPFAERLITMAVGVRKRLEADDPAGALRARRRIEALLTDRSYVPEDQRTAYAEMSDAARARSMRMTSGRRHRTGEPRGRLAFTGASIVRRLIETVAPRFEERPGGYTRLIRLPKPRLGDGAMQARLQFVGDEVPPMSVTKPRTSARKRRADSRYGFAVKVAKGWGKARSTAGASAADAVEPAV